MSFREYQADLSPAFLQGDYGAVYEGALGDAKDSLVERAKRAIKERFIKICSPEAVAQLGVERQMERGPGESLAHYRARLVDAWTAWSYAGTAFGLLTALADAGFTGAVLEIVNGEQYNLDANGALVITALQPNSWLTDYVGSTFWSKFEVLFPAPYPDALAGPPAESSETAQQVKRIVAKWKPGHAICNAIRFLPNATSWDYPPDQVWDDGSVWDDDGVIVTWTA